MVEVIYYDTTTNETFYKKIEIDLKKHFVQNLYTGEIGVRIDNIYYLAIMENEELTLEPCDKNRAENNPIYVL